jgi:hypothetical protein
MIYFAQAIDGGPVKIGVVVSWCIEPENCPSAAQAVEAC